MRHLLLAFALASFSFAAHAQTDATEPLAPPPSIATDPGYAEQFRCPESYADESSRRAATERYLAWASTAHPDWRVDDTLNYRTTLLRAHRCTQTLDSEVDNLPHDAR